MTERKLRCHVLDPTYMLGLIGAVLALAPQVLTYLVHTAYIVASLSKKAHDKLPCMTPSGVSFILPVRKEPSDYLERALEHIGSLRITDYEVIIVSDDDEIGKETVRTVFERARDKGINVWFVWRREPRGMRTGALNTGLYASRGRYVYVYDVDTLPDRGVFECGIAILDSCQECIGVVAKWEPLNRSGRISQPLAYALELLNTILYRARSKLGLHIYPLGTGTLYKADLLKNVLGGWDENRIQDDSELGARLLCTNYRVSYLDKHAVKVENPTTYKSFRVQQSRWAYGALDAALARLKCFLFSRAPLLVRLEAFGYLLQYVPQVLTFIGAVLLTIATILKPLGYVESVFPLFILWLASLILYNALTHLVVWKDASWTAIVSAGRLGALATAISPYIALSTVKAILRQREVYKRTPKGAYERELHSRRIPWELIWGFFFIVGCTVSVLNGRVLTGAVVMPFAASFIYVVARFRKEVFRE